MTAMNDATNTLASAARRALAAWDTTPIKTNADGRLCEAMECLRAALEAQAEQQKRSLNKQLLLLIEAGQATLAKQGAAK
jgi:uncharacterized protein YqgV (UPF0045/DUF77 family)